MHDTQLDVVFTFATETWDDAVARGLSMSRDRLAHRVLTDQRLGRRMIANPFRSPVQRVAQRARGACGRFPERDDAVLVTPWRLRRTDPRHVAGIERAYRDYDRQLAAAGADFDTPAVITSNPFVAAFCPLEWAGPVTFYVTDDWASYPARQGWWPAYRAAYEAVRRRGRRVCAVSAPLLERVAPTGRAEVVPNGIDPDEWCRPFTVPGWFERIPGPRLLYVGNLQDRVDVAALAELADRRPDRSIVLVGPLLDPAHFADLAARPNVVLHGRVGRDEVVALTRSADVCLVPHCRTPLTEAMSPLKLYEYLAAGRPVAAIDLAPMRLDCRGLVLYDEPGALPEAVDRALALGPAPEPERLSFLHANSWERRHELLLDVALTR
ncbi:MAG: glycosyltransferase [Acidimicrobiales bacterium]|nr:glycosyltransferase [Acidimicrobiales bacterium]